MNEPLPDATSRRQALKQGTLLPGPAKWVSPVIQVITMSPAAAQQLRDSAQPVIDLREVAAMEVAGQRF